MEQSKLNDKTTGGVVPPVVRRVNLFSKAGEWFTKNQNFSATTRQAFLVSAASILICGLIALCVTPFMFELSYAFYAAVFLAFMTGLIFGLFFAMVFVTGIIIEQFETIKNKMGIYIMPITTAPGVDSSDYDDLSMKIDKSKLN
jgi:hypothetical protein